MSSQNIYDNDIFYKKYSEFSIVQNGIKNVFEWQIFEELLPNLNGLNILDLGCGLGAFCRECIKQNANSVLGIDLSNNMISEAIKLNKECNIKDINQKSKYEIQDLEYLKLENDKYELIFSRFTFHYIVNLESLFKTIFKSLKSGGVFIFSVEHPFRTSSKSLTSLVKVYNDNNNVENIWPLTNYIEEGERINSWLGVDGIIKQHRTISTYINTLIKCGFNIEQVKETTPTNDNSDNIYRVFILIIKASK